MVDFAVFNEFSLPFSDKYDVEESFILFFKVLKEVYQRGLKKIRMDKDFKSYKILEGTSLQKFFGQIKNQTLKDRLREFLSNGIILIDSPLIRDDELEECVQIRNNDYYYNNERIIGGLACSHIWDTIAVSFDSNDEWNVSWLELKEEVILDDEQIESRNIQVRHLASINHLSDHDNFFKIKEDEQKIGITKNNFWIRRKEFFPEKIFFCKEIERQINKMDNLLFKQSVSVLRDIETNRKKITDYDCSPESESTGNNPKFRAKRLFTIDEKKVFFTNHIKVGGNRIYFLEKNDRIYIGYIGKHLSTSTGKC